MTSRRDLCIRSRRNVEGLDRAEEETREMIDCLMDYSTTDIQPMAMMVTNSTHIPDLSLSLEMVPRTL